jgi:hypothetical protein
MCYIILGILSWPAHCLLFICMKTSPGTCGQCGCTLIDQSTIITAGHCNIGSVDNSIYNIFLGCHDRSDLSTCVSRVATSCTRVKNLFLISF